MMAAAATPSRVLHSMLLISIAVILFAVMDTISNYLTRQHLQDQGKFVGNE